MKDRFNVIISDNKGSKYYSLHHFIKKFILYFILIIVFFIIAGSFLINFLFDELENIERKKEELIALNEELRYKNINLEDNIKAKNKKFEQIKEKISDIEELIGLKEVNTSNFDERLDILKLSSKQQQRMFKHIPNGYPVKYKGISGKFGWRIHPILKKKEFHRGLDLRASMGTELVAPADGIVEFAGYHKSSGFGNLLIIDHNYGFRTSYGHCQKFTVKPGDFVKKGQIVGYTGNSGLSTGPHLHYEIRFIQRSLDPANFTKWNSKNFESIFKKESRVQWQSLVEAINHQYNQQTVQ